jgi:hypothetical protein
MTPEQEFQTAMIEEVYRTALRKHRYNAKLFLEMVGRDGGLQTAKNLLASTGPQYGFTELWERGGLDLTMEHLILQSQWRSLFSEAELQEAEERLRAYALKPPAGKNPYVNHVCTASVCPL